MWRFLCSILAVNLVLLAGSMGQPGTSLSDLRVHDPIQQGNLTVFPISNGVAADTSTFLTLDEGLAQGVVKVGELGALRGSGAMVRPVERPPQVPRDSQVQMQAQITDAGPRVNELAIQNLSNKPLLLLAGEVVSGGKQDRVVARDRIVAPHSEPIPLGVFCVEPGRWHGLSAEFAASKAMAHPKLRKEVTEAKDQRKVWDEVAQSREQVAGALAAEAAGAPATASRLRLGMGGGVLGSSSSYAQAMEVGPVQQKLVEGNRVFLQRMPREAIGVVVAVNGRLVWADLFASSSLFARYRGKLLQSYQVEALGGATAAAKTPTAAEARDFLRQINGRQSIEVEPDLYRLVRTEAAGTVTYELQSLAPRFLTLHTARMAQ